VGNAPVAGALAGDFRIGFMPLAIIFALFVAVGRLPLADSCEN
jgi:hypothetical protein